MITEYEAWRHLIYLANKAGGRGEVVEIAQIVRPSTACGEYAVVFQSRTAKTVEEMI